MLYNQALFSNHDKSGGSIYLSTNSAPKSFNPIIAKETSTTAITNFLFEGLTSIDGISGEVVPNLAKNWQVSQDGMGYVFNLREDVKWFDGKEFTADDVVFTFNDLIYNPDIPNSAADIFTIGEERFLVEKVATFKVKFTLPCKFAPFLRSLTQEILPRHALEKYVKDKSFNVAWGVDALPQEIIGTGSFTLEEYEPGQQVVLKKNPLYWKKDKRGRKLPYIEKIIFIIVNNNDVALLKFQEGKIDYYSLRGSDFPILKPREAKDGFTIFRTGPAFGSTFLVFNLNKGTNPLNNKRFVPFKKLDWFLKEDFRRAVAYAIDRKSMTDIIFNGLAYPQYSPLSEASFRFYNPEVNKYPYNLEKAAKLLKGIGFEDRNDDGFLEDSKGQRVEFNLFANANSTESLTIAGMIIQDLKKLGLKVNFTQLEFNTLVSKLTATYDWEAVILGLSGGIEPHFGSNVWLSSGGLHMWYPKQQSPATEWEKSIDKIFKEAVQELDYAKRKKLYNEWQKIAAEKLPLIYLVVPERIMAIRNKFGNLKPSSLGGAFHNIEEIYIERTGK